MISQKDSDYKKVVELICSKLPGKDYDHYDDVHHLVLLDNDFEGIGMSLEKGLSVINHQIVGVDSVFSVSEIINDVEELDYRGGRGITLMSHPDLFESLYDQGLKPTISFNNCLLQINNVDISFGNQDSKENGCYILEYIFSHDLKEPSDYIDIHKKFFSGEEYKYKRYYDASKLINARVAKKAEIPNLLMFVASERGSVRINPRHLP